MSNPAASTGTVGEMVDLRPAPYVVPIQRNNRQFSDCRRPVYCIARRLQPERGDHPDMVGQSEPRPVALAMRPLGERPHLHDAFDTLKACLMRLLKTHATPGGKRGFPAAPRHT